MTDGPLCANFSDLDWYSDDPEMQDVCKTICSRCTLKFDCAQTALKNKEAWGIWGGMDDFRVRKAIGVDSMERVRKYIDDLYCPFCLSSDLNLPSRKHNSVYPIDCNQCGLEWTTHQLPDKTRKYIERTPHVGHLLDTVSK